MLSNFFGIFLIYLLVEDFDGQTQIVPIPENANQGGTFHSVIRINVYNDGLVEGDEGFFVIFTADEESKTSESVIINGDVIGFTMSDGGEWEYLMKLSTTKFIWDFFLKCSRPYLVYSL